MFFNLTLYFVKLLNFRDIMFNEKTISLLTFGHQMLVDFNKYLLSYY